MSDTKRVLKGFRELKDLAEEHPEFSIRARYRFTLSEDAARALGAQVDVRGPVGPAAGGFGGKWGSEVTRAGDRSGEVLLECVGTSELRLAEILASTGASLEEVLKGIRELRKGVSE